MPVPAICGQCGHKEFSKVKLLAHYQQEHNLEPAAPLPSSYLRRKQAKAAGFALPARPRPSETPSLDRLLAAADAYRAAVKTCVQDLEEERDRISKKLLQLDDAIVKAKKQI